MTRWSRRKAPRYVAASAEPCTCCGRRALLCGLGALSADSWCCAGCSHIAEAPKRNPFHKRTSGIMGSGR